MLLPTLPNPEPGSATGFGEALDANLDQFRQNDQGIEDRLEETFDLFFGRGVIEGTYTSPVVTAGTGLSANIGALVALIGFAEVPASGSVILPASTASTIWLDQFGAFVVTDGTDPSTDENACIVIGTATTDATHVTAHADTFAIVHRPGSSTAGGTVTSVGLSLPGSEFNVSGSPVTVAGTLSGTWKPQTAGKVLAGPASGSAATPSFRALTTTDFPPGIGGTAGIYNVLDYGADPTGNADTSPIIETLLTGPSAIGAAGGVIYYPPGTYWHSTGHTILRKNIAIRGVGMDESVLEFSDDLGSDGNPAPCLYWKGSYAANVALGADCNPGDRTVTLVSGGAASSALQPGDWVMLCDALSSSTSNPNGFFHSRIQSIAGDALTLERRVPYRFRVSQTAVAQYGPFTVDTPHRLLVGASVSDCTIKVGPSSDGSGGRGTEHAPDINRAVLVKFEWCDKPAASRARGVGGALASPVIPVTFSALWCESPRFVDCDARDSGEQGCGYWLQYSTGGRVIDGSTDGVGFGASAQRSAYVRIEGLKYQGRQPAGFGRGAKLEYACTLSTISGCDIADAPFFGAYVSESWDCAIDGNLIAYNGGPDIPNQHGIQSGGDLAVGTRITNNTVKGPSGYGISVNPATNGTSTKCLIAGNRLDRTNNGIYLGGSDNDVKGNTLSSYGAGGGVGVSGFTGSARNRIQNNTFLNGGSGYSVRTDGSAGGNFIGGNTDDGLTTFLPHPTDVLLDKKPTGATLVVAASDSRDPTRADAGFRCDGTADDVEVQAAVNALSAKGGTVVLLEGTYSFNAPVSLLASNVSVVGSGAGTVLKRNFVSSSTGLVNLGNGTLALSGFVLRDFSIDGQKGAFAGATNYGIAVASNVSDAEIENVRAANCAGDSFATGAATRIQFRGCRSTGSGVAGYRFAGALECALLGSVSASDSTGVNAVSACAGLRIQGSHVTGAGAIGIYVGGGTRAALVGNTVSGCASQGIYLDGVTGYTVTGNEATGSGFHGIRIRATDGTVTGNVSGPNTGSGIVFLTATRAVCSGNSLSTNTAFGIDISSDSTGIVLGPNRFNANTSGTVSDAVAVTAAGGTRNLGQGGSVRSATAAFTLTGDESLVECDATSAAFTVTLPAAAAALRNWRVVIKKQDASANAVTIGGTTDGVANRTLTAQYDSLAVVCDGAAYMLERPAVIGAGSVSPIEGNTIVVAASDSLAPTRADAAFRCTGTNDQTLINTAITALGTKGGTVKLLEGTYTVGAAVTIAKSNVTLRGQGPGTVIKRAFNSGGVGGGTVIMGDGSTQYSGIVVRDLAIDGNKAAQTSSNNCGLVALGSLSDCDVERVVAFNAVGANFYSNSLNPRMRMTGCRSSGASNVGILLAWVRSEMSGCSSDGDVLGLQINSGADQFRLYGNSIYNATGNYGAWLTGATRVAFVGNTIHTAAAACLRLEGVTFATVTGNFIQGGASTGVTVYNSNDVTLQGNVVTNNTGSGVWIPGSNRVTVSGNHLLNNTTYGLEIRNDATQVIVGPNRYQSNTTAPALDQTALTAANGTRFLGQGGTVRQATAAFTLSGEESVVECDATSAAFAVTLPAAASWMRGWRVALKKTDSSSNAVTLIGTVDGTTNPTLGSQWATATILCDGSAYRFEAPPGAGEPVGTMKVWPAAVAPSGYLLCDGSAVSRTTYAALFALISTAYGTGDGSTTFNLPDLRGRVAAGSTGTLGATGGAGTHTHPLSTAATVGAPTLFQPVDNSGATPRLAVATSDHIHQLSGNTDAQSSWPPYLMLNWIIKAS